jgi:pyridoxamine 5'-phosphate oxidase
VNPEDLHKIRNEYQLGELDEHQVDPDPMKQFELWMKQAIEARIEEPTAMTLATADVEGKPAARMVLLKGFDEQGFIFYTNYSSRKGRQLESNPHAALAFYWKEFERQVRIEGIVKKVAEQESDNYFSSRPGPSQVSAIISPQSEIIPNRQFLIDLQERFLQSNADHHSRPQHWGGYRLKPNMIEFWQGRPGRLHDRIRYRLSNSNWVIERLAP